MRHINFTCGKCGEENYTEDLGSELTDYDIRMVEGDLLVHTYAEHVRISHDDWDKLYQVWRAHYANIGRNKN